MDTHNKWINTVNGKPQLMDKPQLLDNPQLMNKPLLMAKHS